MPQLLLTPHLHSLRRNRPNCRVEVELGFAGFPDFDRPRRSENEHLEGEPGDPLTAAVAQSEDEGAEL